MLNLSFNVFNEILVNSQVTIIIPTFKRPQLLKRAVQSVLAQTYQHFQICIYDNNSSDETAEIANQFIKGDSRVNYHCHSKNIGMIANYQYGFEQVQTPYFCFLSDDDYYLPFFLETALHDLNTFPKAGFSACAVKIINPNKEALYDTSFYLWEKEGYFEVPDGFLELILPFFKPFTPTCTLFNRKILGNTLPDWSEKIQLLWDADYFLRIAAKFPFFINKKICGFFVAHENGFSSGVFQRAHNCPYEAKKYLDGSLHILDKIKRNLHLDIEIKQKAKREIIRFFFSLFKYFIHSYQDKKKIRSVVQLIKIAFKGLKFEVFFLKYFVPFLFDLLLKKRKI